MLAPLFHRFETPSSYKMKDFSRDVADILSSRQVLSFNAPGILSWGLPNIHGLAPVSAEDRQRVAEYVQTALTNFEPRLEGVRVIATDDKTGFSFRLEAVVFSENDNEDDINFKIVAPPISGGLGAEVSDE